MYEQWKLQEALEQGIEARRIRRKNIAQAIAHELAGEKAISDSVKEDTPIIQEMATYSSQLFVLIEELLLRSDVRLGVIQETEEIRDVIQERHATTLMESDPEIVALNPRSMALFINKMPPDVIQKCFSAEHMLQEQRLIILRALDDLRPEANK